MSFTDLTSKATSFVEERLPRRSFVARSAVAATALASRPTDYLLKPISAYAAVCSCSGSACACGSQCCDGYTEFCCTITGANSCPPGSVIGGWWKVGSSSYCGNGPRYYMDCHKPCGPCTCGGSGICSGSCNGTACGCANGSCGNRKAGCTHFRYGNCATGTKCLGPIQCRVVTCRAPWTIDPSCTTTSRTDENTRFHNRPCLQAPAVLPVVGDWDGDGADGIGVYWPATRRWDLRQTASAGGANLTFRFGGPGDVPVVGDWNGSGRDGIGVYRPSTGQWLLRNSASAGGAQIRFSFGGRGDIPVVGDWSASGRAGIGVFRPSRSEWLLRNTPSGGGVHRRFRYGGRGDHPVTGCWTGDPGDDIGVYRPWNAEWLLRYSVAAGGVNRRFSYGPHDY